MSGFIGANLIDYNKLTVQQRNRLKQKLRSRIRALKAQLAEVNKALKVVEKKSKKSKR